MRFSILAKIGILIAVVLVATMATVLWNTNRVFYEDKKAFVNELSSKLSQGAAQVVTEKFESLRSKVAVFTSNYESLSPAQKKETSLNQYLFSQYENFYALAAIRSSDKSYRWKVTNEEKSKAWPIGFDDQLFRTTNLDFSNNQALQFQSLRLSDGSPCIAVVMKAQLQVANDLQIQKEAKLEEVVLVAIVAGDIFQGVVSNFKAALNTVFLVDKSGSVFAHPEDSLLGSSLLEESVVSEIAQSNKMAGVGDSYKSADGQEIAASYEKIPGSNLYSVVTTPRKEAFRAANELFKSLIVIGLGVLLVGLTLSVVFAQLLTAPLKKLKFVAAEIGSGNFDVDMPTTSQDEVGDLASSIQQMASSLMERDSALEHSKNALVQSEKMSAFGQLSAGIAHEVKNPLAGILGHAQLAKAKVKDESIRKHIEVIESETRRTKEIIENLMKFARAEKMDLVPTNLWDTVQAAVDLVEHQLSLMNVKISRSITRVPAVRANSNQIQQVLLNLMMNAGHAMEESETKKLHITLSYVEDKSVVRIEIRDSGHGMTEEVQKKIFEPFFTTKPAGKGTGLGLSVTIGIVKDHNAKIYVESAVGVGTSFFIELDEAKDCELPVPTYVPKFDEQEVAEQAPLQERNEPSKVDSPTLSVEDEEPMDDFGSESVISQNTGSSIELQDMEDEDELAEEEVSQVGIPLSIPKVPGVLEERELAESKIDDEAEEDFQILENTSSSFEDSDQPSSYSAADALAGMSLDGEDDEESYLEERTVFSEIPSMPPVDVKTSDKVSSLVDSEEEESKPSQDFKVNIRKPKLKR